MKPIIALLLAILTVSSSFAVGKIQNEGVKSLADIQSSVNSITGNLSSGTNCIASPSSVARLAVGQFIYDSTSSTKIPAATTIAGLPGTCTTGQIQMSQNAAASATGDTITFGGQKSQLINSDKLYDIFNSQQLSKTISDGSIGSGSATSGQVLTANGSGATTYADPTTGRSSPTEAASYSVTAVGSGTALTISLKQPDGTSDPTLANPVKISMRSSTASSGAYNERSITGALSQVLTQWTSLAVIPSIDTPIWIYAIDSDGLGGMRLGASVARYDNGTLQSTVAESFNATYDHTTSKWTATGHGLVAGDAVHLTTTNTVPSGYTNGNIYWVMSAGLTANVFELAGTISGSVVTATTNDGTGTHSMHYAGVKIATDAVYTSKPVTVIARGIANNSAGSVWNSLSPLTTTDLAPRPLIVTQPREEMFAFSASCTTGTCSLAWQTPGISSVTFVSTGLYTINFNPPWLTAVPICSFNSEWPNTYLNTNPTLPVLQVQAVISAAAGTLQNDKLYVRCVGPW